MSYSFSVRASSKASVALLVAAELERVVEAQSIHAKDAKAALAAAEALIEVLANDADADVRVDMSGSVGWRGTDEVRSVNVQISAYCAERENSQAPAEAATPAT